MTGATRGRLLASGIIVAGWTFLALVFTPQIYLLSQRSPVPLAWPQAFLANAAMFYGWAALTPLVIWLGRRWPFDRRRIGRFLFVHLTMCFVVAGVHLTFLRYASPLLLGGLTSGRVPVPLVSLLVGYGATNVMIYWGVVAMSQAITYFRRYQEHELRLVEAELQSLRAQLQPHFLFNTLNAIAELIYQDPGRAERTLTRLSNLLRLVLLRGQHDEVALNEEVLFLRGYLEIQQTLLRERLTVRWHIANEALDGRVPTMILQPLVENAIQHGIAPRVSGGCITVTAQLDDGLLQLTVEDDGVGLRSGGEDGCSGVGLANTRARLRHLYGEDHKFAVSAGNDGHGVRVRLTIPFEPAPPRNAR